MLFEDFFHFFKCAGGSFHGYIVAILLGVLYEFLSQGGKEPKNSLIDSSKVSTCKYHTSPKLLCDMSKNIELNILCYVRHNVPIIGISQLIHQRPQFVFWADKCFYIVTHYILELTLS